MENNFLHSKINVINMGLSSFAEPIKKHGGDVTQLIWSPPAEGDKDIGFKLAQLIDDETIEKANNEAFSRYLASQPVLWDIGVASKDIPNMKGKLILHSGPPIVWDDMCGPQKGAILGAILFEKWASNLEDAEKLVTSKEVKLAPCHHYQSVGPMAGIISPSMPVWIIKDTNSNLMSYCNFNEGLGKVLRFGANSADVIERLHWMADVLAPTLKAILAQMEPMELKPLMAQALHMGDEVHNRNMAASALFFRKLTVAALSCEHINPKDLEESLSFIAANDHFFLNLSMAACKVMLDAADGVENSTLVTAMARNGVKFGIKLSGLKDKWFTADAAYIDGLFFAGFSMDDAARDLGDSAITETAGVGGFSMAASPAIVQFVGGSPQDALNNTKRMFYITHGQNHSFTLPSLDFMGCPAMIDARKVVDTSIAPIINTGIAHKKAGIGQIGAGITYAPLSCFSQAIGAFFDYKITKGEAE